jgi:hypothetical protein
MLGKLDQGIIIMIEHLPQKLGMGLQHFFLGGIKLEISCFPHSSPSLLKIFDIGNILQNVML